MQPNCPGYQERLCLSSWNRYSTRTGKARKNRTQRENFLARKTTETFSHVRLQISALGRRFAISHGSNQLIQCLRIKFRSKVERYMLDRRISQRSSVDLIGQCHGNRHVTYDSWTGPITQTILVSKTTNLPNLDVLSPDLRESLLPFCVFSQMATRDEKSAYRWPH